MPIVTCPNCEKALRLRGDALGKKVRCPSCKAIIIPSGAEIVSDEKLAPKGVAGASTNPRVVSEVVDEPVEDAAPARSPSSGPAQRTRIGILLMAMGTWGTVAALSLGLIFLILQWSRVSSSPQTRQLIVGIPGLLAWLTGLAGAGLCISGLRKNGALGLAIAVGSVGLVHVGLMVWAASAQRDTAFTPPRNLPAGPYGSPFPLPSRSGDFAWSLATTSLPYASLLFGVFSDSSAGYTTAATKIFYLQADVFGRIEFNLGGILAGLIELALFVLLMLYLRSVATASRNYGTAQSFLGPVFGMPTAVLLLFLLNLVVFFVVKPTSSGTRHALYSVQLLQYLAIIGVSAWAAILMLATYKGIRVKA